MYIYCRRCASYVILGHECISLPKFDPENIESVKSHIYCYCCGDKNVDNFSKTQIQKIGRAKCKACISAGKQHKDEVYDEPLNLTDQMEDAIMYHDIFRVVILLFSAEADPNGVRQMRILDRHRNRRYCYTADGIPLVESNSESLPSTPLKAVVFKLSDCLLTENEIAMYSPIADLLLQYGADPDPAIKYYMYRYGFGSDDFFKKLLKASIIKKRKIIRAQRRSKIYVKILYFHTDLCTDIIRLITMGPSRSP